MKVKKTASGVKVKKFGTSGGSKIGGGANKRAGALIASPAKDAMAMRKGH